MPWQRYSCPSPHFAWKLGWRGGGSGTRAPLPESQLIPIEVPGCNCPENSRVTAAGKFFLLFHPHPFKGEKDAFGARSERLNPAADPCQSGAFTRSHDPSDIAFCSGPKMDLLQSPGCMRKQRCRGRTGLGSEETRASWLVPQEPQIIQALGGTEDKSRSCNEAGDPGGQRATCG